MKRKLSSGIVPSWCVEKLVSNERTEQTAHVIV